MKIGMKYLFEKNPALNVVIFAGKGGLGKTTLSAALSFHLSSKIGKNLLCFSTDPQASLSDVFERSMFGKGEVEVAEKLHVLEIDADKKIAEYTESIKNKIKDMYKIDEVPKEIDEYIDSAATEPAMYESAVYDAMLQVVSKKKYDFHIFDMPPFGHGIRMISIADILSKWVEKITTARKTAAEYDKTAKRMKKFDTGEKELIFGEEEFLGELLEIGSKITSFRALLTNPVETAFVMVLTPEKMSIVDTERARTMFEDLNLKIKGFVINQLYPPSLLDNPNASEYLKNRVLAQRPMLQEIWDKFSDLVIGVVPMFNKEPKGLDMIARAAEELWEPTIDLESLIRA